MIPRAGIHCQSEGSSNPASDQKQMKLHNCILRNVRIASQTPGCSGNWSFGFPPAAAMDSFMFQWIRLVSLPSRIYGASAPSAELRETGAHLRSTPLHSGLRPAFRSVPLRWAPVFLRSIPGASPGFGTSSGHPNDSLHPKRNDCNAFAPQTTHFLLQPFVWCCNSSFRKLQSVV